MDKKSMGSLTPFQDWQQSLGKPAKLEPGYSSIMDTNAQSPRTHQATSRYGKGSIRGGTMSAPIKTSKG